MQLFDTVLVANRGEIAIRVARTLDALGIRSIAVYAESDPSPHRWRASEAVSLGDGSIRDTYLSIEKILDAARASGAQAIHPGYGFLSENAAFARACEEAGIVFIGPSALAIETMGDKISARHAVESRGVATVPGIAEPGLDDDALIAGAERVGYPVLIKPAAGGGGKGMYRVDDPAQLPAALQAARREAKSAFGDDTLFIERFVSNPRHIEVQVLADTHGTVIHLGERECSLQRRHQKVVEEAPSALLTEAQRAAIGQAAVETARSVGYVGAGTVEFIVAGDAPDEPFFMEMNTRLQVEHPVTEMVTGIDLVEQQLRIAAGEPLAIAQEDVRLEGHAIEARIYAEDPAAGFLPTGGQVLDLRWAEGTGVRVDAGVDPGGEIGSSYDPMIAKVIAHGATRDEAIDRLDRALAETTVLGVTTNRTFLRALLAEPAVRAGELDTGLIDREAERLTATAVPSAAFAAAAAAAGMLAFGGVGAWQRDGWRISGSVGRVSHHRDGAGIATVRVRRASDPGDSVPYGGGVRQPRLDVDIEVTRADGSSERIAHMLPTSTSPVPEGVWVGLPEGDFLVERHVRIRSGRAAAEPTLASPMPGTVVAVHASDGDRVEEGQAVVSVEAMKMEHVLRAPVAGAVHLHARVGEQVTRGQELATVTPSEQEDA